MALPGTLRTARPNELDEICELFWEVADAMEGSGFDASWRRERYPSREDLAAPLEAGELYVLDVAGELVGGFVLNGCSAEGYADVPWPSGLPDTRQRVLHLLAVRPAWRRRGIARELVRRAVDIAHEQGAGALRLDVIPSNLPARELYESLGFQLAASTQLYYEDTGTIDFDLMELVL